MFTGIIETVGTITQIAQEQGNSVFYVRSSISKYLKLGQSVSHNGVCLTITKVYQNTHCVTSIKETLLKSNFAFLKTGHKINLERSLLSHGRFDGHIVQGHIDQIGTCVAITKNEGSWLVEVGYDASTKNITIEKGSIAINGVSLTCFNTRINSFTVAIIPHTLETTTLNTLNTNTSVNLEFDIIGKYVQKLNP